MKIKLILMSVLLAIGLFACSPFGTEVIVDNRTSQTFIVVLDNYQYRDLVAGGVMTVWVHGTSRQLQLRWVGENGVGTLYIPIDTTMRKVYIQGLPDNFIIDRIGVEKG